MRWRWNSTQVKIVLAGCSGFIGQALTARLLALGHEVVILTRAARRVTMPSHARCSLQIWDAKTVGPWADTVAGAAAVINLAGESVAARRWSPAQKARIISSRVDATRALVEALGSASSPPRVLINASATGYYGDVPEGEVDEDHPSGQGFLAETCRRWEAEASLAAKGGARVVMLRSGVVLDLGGGALAKMWWPFRLGLGGRLGTGLQWFSWIQREDAVAAIVFVLANQGISGPVNLTAPEPVTNEEFSRELGQVLKRPTFMAVPAVVLKIAMGEVSQMLLTGHKVVPKKLLSAGFTFRYPDIKAALAAIFSDR